MDWCDESNIAVIPYGGGSSVCGGVETQVGDSYSGAVSLDLRNLNKIIEIDRESRSARIQAGILGPDLESNLKKENLTMRHYPQSFEFYLNLNTGIHGLPEWTTDPDTVINVENYTLIGDFNAELIGDFKDNIFDLSLTYSSPKK